MSSDIVHQQGGLKADISQKYVMACGPTAWQSPLTVLTDNVGTIDKHADMSIDKNNVIKPQIISADDVRWQNDIKVTIDIVGRHHPLTMMGHVVQLLHPCFSHWLPQ